MKAVTIRCPPSPRAVLFLLLLGASLLAWAVTGDCAGAARRPFTIFFHGQFVWLGISLIAMFVMHALTLSRAEMRWRLALGALAEMPALLYPSNDGKFVIPPGLGFALASLSYRSLLFARSRGDERAWHARTIFDSLVPAWAVTVCSPFLACTGAILPRVRDLEIQAIGGGLGPWPPLLVGRLFSQVTPLRAICTAIYAFLLVGLAVTHAFRLRADRNGRPTLLLSFVLIALFGYPLYFLLPLVGPREAWACAAAGTEFPPASWPMPITLEVLAPSRSIPRNCMPSLHTAWSLVLALESRHLGRPLRMFGLFWFMATVLATLGLGEHWLIDLVVAIPFTLAVHALARGGIDSRRARITLGALTALVAAWMVALIVYTRDLEAHPSLVALAMLLTPVASAALATAPKRTMPVAISAAQASEA